MHGRPIFHGKSNLFNLILKMEHLFRRALGRLKNTNNISCTR